MLGGLLRRREMPASMSTAVAMTGARGGDRVLVVGSGEPSLPPQITKVTGLSGHVIVADRAEGAAKRVEAAAQRAGAFVEFEDAAPTKLPFPDDDFNVVVANHRLSNLTDSDRVQCLIELRRVLKPGGRAIAIEAAARAGFLGVLPGRAAAISIADLQAAFERAGWRTPRELATKDGVLYLEALKPRTT